jgi:nickel superoxide dismutase
MIARTVFLTLASTALLSSVAFAHCEVPCGIYADRARIDALYEDAATIEKAMKQIAALSGKTDAQSVNQCVRWVQTKEEHAKKVQHTTWQYFMTQRVKLPKDDAAKQKKGVEQLVALHGMLKAAMKCKQTVDPANAKALRAAIDAFSATYFSAADLEHIRKGHGKKPSK